MILILQYKLLLFLCFFYLISLLLADEQVPLTLITFEDCKNYKFDKYSNEPPRLIPESMYQSFTLGDVIPVVDMYKNDINSKQIIFTIEETEKYILEMKNRDITITYPETNTLLYDILDKYHSLIENKIVGIIGSRGSRYESYVLAHGGKPITIEYNKIINEDPRILTFTPNEYKANPIIFDVVISISSIEHDGLGRYGDPLNPFGDIEEMRDIKSMIKKDGIFILSVPIGKDLLVWNAMRIYGSLRLPLLLNEWTLLETFGFNEKQFDEFTFVNQPLFILQNT
jgi:hypothetical protein